MIAMKVKKGLAILLATSACFSFVACEEQGTPEPAPAHEHSWATEWSKDKDNHWHACTGDDCTEVAEKEAHTWNDGEITTAPTASADGVKTYTCSVCAQTKTEPVVYVVSNEVTANEWLSALSFAGESNYKIYNDGGDIIQITEVYGTTIRMKATAYGQVMVNEIATIEGGAYYSYSISEEKISKIAISESIYASNKTMAMATTFLFADFTYDAQSKTYKAESIQDGSMTYTNVEMQFENGKLVSMTMSYFMGVDIDCSVTVTYGEVEEIQIPDLDITEEQWIATKAKFEDHSVPKTFVQKQNGNVFTVKWDGVTLYSHQTSGEYHKIYTKIEDKYYRFTKTGDEAWVVTELDQNSYVTGYTDTLNIIKGNAQRPNYQYIEYENGNYIYELYGYIYTYYFIDGELRYLTSTYNGGFTISVNYDVPQIDVPALPNPKINSSTEWNAAFATAMDLTSARTMSCYIYNPDTQVENRLYSTSITENLVYVNHAYYQVVYENTNGEIYEYMNSGSGFEKNKRTDRTWDYLVNSAISSGGYSSYIIGEGSYVNTSYNAQGAYYEYNADLNLYRAYFDHGALIKLEVFIEGVKSFIFKFDYNTPVIQIPQV